MPSEGRPAAPPLTAVSPGGQAPPALVSTRLFLAMAHHQLKDDKTARDWFDKATARLNELREQKPGRSGVGPTVSKADLLELQLLRDEAERLLKP